MALRNEHPQRLVALFALGCVLFSGTLLACSGRGDRAGCAGAVCLPLRRWAVLVALMALVVELHD